MPKNPRQNPRVFSQAGFSLVELLVVLAILAILAALLVTGLARAKFRAKVAACSNNFRQISLASTLYSLDAGGLLPSHMLMTSSTTLTNYGSIEPWFVSFALITNLSTYGVVPTMWFCPTRSRWESTKEYFEWKTSGRSLSTGGDLVDYYHQQGAPMAFLDMFWWVPRPLEGLGNILFPDPRMLNARVSDAWPTKSEDRSASIKPIASDWLLGEWDETAKAVTFASGGHSYGAKIRSSNSAFADGHVETRPFSSVQWQMKNNKKNSVYLY